MAEELLREAETKSRRIVDQAEREAENRRNHADAYALRTLRDLERDLAAATGSIRKGIDVLAGSALAAGSNTPVPSPEDFAPEEPAQTFSRR
jgi:hypothetical protein